MTHTPENDFNPSFHFLGLLQKAVADGLARRCALPGGPELYLAPQQNAYYTVTPNIDALDPLCNAAPFDLTVEALPDWNPEGNGGGDTVQVGRMRLRKQTASPPSNLISRPLPELLWYATLCVSHGRLLRGYRADEPVRLKRCPDFSALHHRKSHLTLAAFMVEETADLATIAKNTGIPLGQVFNFHNACAVLGLIERGDGQYHPRNYLIGLVQDAIADQLARRCALPGHPPLFIAPGASQFHFAGDAAALATLCAAARTEFKVDILDSAANDTKVVQIGRMRVSRKPDKDLATLSGSAARPLSDLLFAASLGSSRGRLPADADTAVAVRLNRWPDAFCLEQDHRFFPLGMYMMANTATLPVIAERTSIPLAKVVDFHNACAALGLVDRPEQGATTLRTRRLKTEKNIKLVFTGSVGAGKTTAISLLSEIAPVLAEATPTDEVSTRKHATTVSMDYGELTLDDGPRLKLYGTPGQRRFAFMCDVLTKGALGLIVLVNNVLPNPLEELNHFLDLNAEFLQRQPAVIGVTHLDMAGSADLALYQQHLAERGAHWPVLPTDARKRDDLIQLLDALLSALEYS